MDLVDRLLGTEGEDRNGDIDEALASLLPRYPQDAPYDLINGLTGLGVYALARWPGPGAAPCLLGVVDQLARRAQEDQDGIYWWTPLSWRGLRGERYRPAGVDLGVAHGIAGVIPFLARVHRLGLARPVVRPLLEGAVGWLLAHLVDTASGPTVPYFVAEGVEPGPARSAWCYGDPGVAMALLLAARDVGDLAWATAATDLALRAAARPAEQTGVTDAGLCHGSAGLAHLFNRLYQLTAEQALADAARFWVERTLELCSASAPGESAPGADAPGRRPPGRRPQARPPGGDPQGGHPNDGGTRCGGARPGAAPHGHAAGLQRPRTARGHCGRGARLGGRGHHGRTRLGPDAAGLLAREPGSPGTMKISSPPRRRPGSSCSERPCCRSRR